MLLLESWPFALDDRAIAQTRREAVACIVRSVNEQVAIAGALGAS
jgi:hypothetical protein